MQFGLPLGGEVLMLVFVVLYWVVIIGGIVKLIGWIVDRRTKVLRQRVALLEHEVDELQERSIGRDTASEGQE